MTLVELIRACCDGMMQQQPGVRLLIPKGKKPKGFPRGELLEEHHNGDRIYLFSPSEILAYLIRGGGKYQKKRVS